MGSRVSSGATLSGIPLATALWAASAGHYWLVTLGVIGVVLVLTATVAPWSPLLHRLPPPVGAPKVPIRFRQLARKDHRYPGVILEVGLKPSTRLEDATLNFRFPRDGLGHTGVRSLGHSYPSNILPLADFETASPTLWWWSTEDLRVASIVLWFQFIPLSGEKQIFDVTMVVASEKLHGNEARADFQVHYDPAEHDPGEAHG